MGTRNLTIAIANGQTKLAQYGQWDGYPESAGTNIVEFLRTLDEAGRGVFKQKVLALTEINEETMNECWAKVGFDRTKSNMIPSDIADQFKKLHPHLWRDMGSEVVKFVYESAEPLAVRLDEDFGASGSCEWAYIINLDTDELQVYTGYLNRPATGDDYFQKFVSAQNDSPALLIKSFDIKELPTPEIFCESIKQMLAMAEED